MPYDKYPTRTCEIFIASGNNGQFRKLCELIGRPELADDPRFANNGERNVNRDALGARLGRRVRRAGRQRTGADRLIRSGVPAGPVLPVDEATAAPHTAHREMVTELDWYKGLGTPIKLSPHAGRHAPPAAALRPAWRGGAGATRLFGSRDRRVAARRRAAQQAADLTRRSIRHRLSEEARNRHLAPTCHCEARSAEAIPCLTNRGTLVRQEIASALRASQ